MPCSNLKLSHKEAAASIDAVHIDEIRYAYEYKEAHDDTATMECFYEASPDIRGVAGSSGALGTKLMELIRLLRYIQRTAGWNHLCHCITRTAIAAVCTRMYLPYQAISSNDLEPNELTGTSSASFHDPSIQRIGLEQKMWS